MTIEKVFIGGWFQRTTLQLSEVYDFLRDASSRLELNKKKLVQLHASLNLTQVEYHVDGMEYLIFSTQEGIRVKITEDGLIVLSFANSKEYSLFTDLDMLAQYYEKKLSPAISYLFSLGAPVPKELANIETVYPYFIVLNQVSDEDIHELLAKTEGQKYFEFQTKNYNVLRGDKYYFINIKDSGVSVERYIEEQIFIREFKAQLHRYLNLHRIIWEKIADVKENANITGKQIMEYSSKIDGYAKTINLIDGRIKQMSTYIKTREKIAKNDRQLEESLEFIGYRYETLGNTLTYIQHLWNMTQNYVKQAQTLFNGLEAKVTSKSIKNLTIVTSMGVGASLIDLFTESRPKFSSFGILYFFILAFIGFSVNKIMNYISERRVYKVNDIEYDKNIGK